ncbi:MAG: hypothetical protein AMXMBFR84_48610 [Candidatus Hydrogenedentota bacterium]
MFPIVLGLCGLLYVNQVPTPFLQSAVILLSVGAPLFAVGHLLARVQTGGFQRIALVVGVVLLIVGAMGKVFNLGDELQDMAEVPTIVWEASQYIGLASLILGLFTVLLIVVWREEEIGEVAQQFKFLASHMSEGFIVTGPDGTIRLVNQAFLDMTGLAESEVLGRNSREMAERFNLEPMFPHIESRSSGLASEYSIPWRNGGEAKQLWFNGTPIFDHQGRFAGALATVRDITHQHQIAERLERYTRGLQELVEDRTQQLRQSEERMRALLLHMNEGFLTVGGNYRIRFANECIGRLLNRPTASLIGRDVFEFIEPAERGKVVELFRTADSHAAEGTQQEVRLMRQGGQALPVMVSVAPIEQAPDEDARYSLVVTDVTQLKSMQAELEARAQELEEVNADLRMLDRAKDAFLSNVSHELRTPLSTIRGYVEMLNTSGMGTLQPQQQAALNVMRRNVDRLGTLIDEIIEFSRMEIRGIQLQRTLFNPMAVARECCDSARPHAIAKDITIHVGTPDIPLYAWGDRKRIGQVLTILLSNAIKFTRPSGHIQLAVTLDGEGALRIAVQDTGIGIDPRYHRRVFDKFFQVDSTWARRYEGAGIGLSIAKSVVEAHGGRIELSSVPGKGSSFTVVLPHVVFGLPGHAFADDALAGKTALLISDSTDLVEAVTSVLRNLGMTIHAQNSGYGGIRHANEEPHDIILVDESLQDFGGTGFLNRLREGANLAGTPIVVFSGGESSEAMLGAESDGSVVMLAKPFSAQSLQLSVHSAFQLPTPFEKDTDTARDPLVRSIETRVLAVGADPELMDWLATALNRRNVACIVSNSTEMGLSLIESRSPSAVLLDMDNAEAAPELLIEHFREECLSRSVPLFLLTGLDPEGWQQPGVTAVFRKPFGIREIVERLAHASSMLAYKE